MAGVFQFKGGVHPLRRIEYGKTLTEDCAITPCPVPDEVVIPLSQHIGAPSAPIVKAGDKVDLGQKIAEASGNVSVPCFASVSGTVKAIEPRFVICGQAEMSIVIENDFEDRPASGIGPAGTVESMSPAELLERVRAAGIVGMGGAAFPTHVKLSPPPNKKIDTVIINGAECEPYLTADYRVMLEHPQRVVTGLKAVMKILGAQNACIAMEDNKPEAAEVLRRIAGPDVRVVMLKVKYPQGAEKQLIYGVTGRRVPSGGLPMDVGVVVVNAGTARQIALAVEQGVPLYERVVTVTGSVAKPCNMLVRIGTPIEKVFEAAGGFTGDISEVLAGGPMMGIAMCDLRAPVVKGTSGLLALDAKVAHMREPSVCIRCGRCVAGCPMGLSPYLVSAYADAGRFDDAEKHRAMDCIECGCCTYSCPAGRHMVQSIRLAKAEITKARRKKA